MPEPVTHNASMHSVMVPKTREVPPNEEKVEIEKDPLVSFEHFHFQIATDLRNWMTFTEDDRMRRTALFGSPVLEDAKPLWGRDEYKWTPRRRHKVLNYIIWVESIHPLGKRSVAALAFNALFPKEKKVEG